MFDRDELMDLTDGDAELAQELVETFLDDLPKQLEAVQSALASGDLEALHRAAHTLKGAVGNFCCPSAFEAARQLDDLARNGETAGLDDAHDALCAELDKLGPALRDWAATL